MTSSHENNSMQAVTIISVNPYDQAKGWQATHIYQWHDRTIEVWKGPSRNMASDQPACELKQSATEIAFLDLGQRGKQLVRGTGTIFGELISFEQPNAPGLFHSTIEVRLAIKEELSLSRKLGKVSLIRKSDGAKLAWFDRQSLYIETGEIITQAEAVAAVLIHSSNIAEFLRPPLKRFLRRTHNT